MSASGSKSNERVAHFMIDIHKKKTAGENQLFKYSQQNCKKSFLVQRDIQQPICGECVIFI